MSEQPPPVFFNLTGEVGPWVIGNVISSLLFGMICLQIVVYFVRSPHDHIGLKGLVVALVTLAAMSWGADLWMLWRILVQRNDEWSLIKSPKEAMIPLAVAPFCALLNQSYFGWRTFKLANRNMWLAALFIFLMACSFAAGMGRIVVSSGRPFLVYGAPDLANFPGNQPMHDEYWLSMNFLQAFLIISGVTDVVITTSLALHLTRSEAWQRGFNQRTDALVSKILKLSIMTGAVSSTSAFIDGFLIIGTVRDHSNFNAHLAVCLIQPHVYTLVLVGSLNMRRVINADHASTRPRSRSWSYFTVASNRLSGSGTGSGTASSSTHVPRSFHYSKDMPEKRDPFGQSPPGTPGSPRFMQQQGVPSLSYREANYPPLPSPPPPFLPGSPSVWSPPPPMTPLESAHRPPASPTRTRPGPTPHIPGTTIIDIGVAR